MRKNVYELKIDDDIKTIGSKTTNVKKSKAQNEIEEYGIVEINNSSSKNKVKNAVDKGYEKEISGKAKKNVKKNLSMVDDYFDFNFRANLKLEENEEIVCNESFNDTKSEQIFNNEIIERQVSKIAETCNRFELDPDAMKIMTIARTGYLFD